MVWLNRSPIPVGRRGYFTRSNNFYLPSLRLEEEGGVGLLHQGGRTQHDFSLAWLEAAWYCSESGHGTTRNEPVQKMLCKLCIYYSTTLVLNSRVLLMYTDTVKELPGYPVQNCPCGSFLFWGGSFGRGTNCMCYCLNGMPQKETLENVRTPVCFHILSSSPNSVSIFSVCCYSIVSISVIYTLPYIDNSGVFFTDQHT